MCPTRGTLLDPLVWLRYRSRWGQKFKLQVPALIQQNEQKKNKNTIEDVKMNENEKKEKDQ